jgi:uncharacterized protein (TIGR00730 family)
VSEPVLGPGARGVVVALDEPERALRARLNFQNDGIPAATAEELGLQVPEVVRQQVGAGDDLGSYWALALRRPVLANDGRGETVLRDPQGTDIPTLEDGGSGALRKAVARPPSTRVAVFGGAWVEEQEAEFADARRFGERLASAATQVICGGYGGIMAAVCQGSAQSGGVAVGVTIGPWTERVRPNQWMTHEVVARDMFARLPLIFDAEAWVAFPGGAGTLAEIALGWNLVQTRSVEPRPIVLIGERWGQALDALRPLLLVRDQSDFDLVRRAHTADEAADLVLELAPR